MREELFSAIIESQKKLIKSLEANLETLGTTTDLDEEMTRDLDAHSHQSHLQTMEIKWRQKLEMEKEDLKNIQAMRLAKGDEIQTGSIVETDENYFFFGYAFSPIKYEQKQIFGVSPQAPAFNINQGKKAGDELQLGERKLSIKAVY